MSHKNSYLTVTDQFCGAGGSSQGVRNLDRKIKGLEVKLALNHWKLAIETHNTNFPNTIHDCTDISASDPRRYPSTDILITSPECTNHSLANGKKKASQQMDLFDKGVLDPAAERSRATMWDVPRFAEYHNYNAIIVESVVDARKWVMFESWLHAMHALGYNHKCVYLNSMHCHPTPQSRDRMYIVFWKKGNKAPKLDYTPLAHCHKCGEDVRGVQSWKDPRKQFGKYRQQYLYCCPKCSTVVEPYYYAAFNCIDWSDIGTRIGDRAKPLSPKTITRIEYGLKKYGSQPLSITTKYDSENPENGARSLTESLRTQTSEQGHGVLTPFQVINYSPGYTKDIKDSFASITTQDHHGIVTPFIVNDQQSTGVNFRTKSITDHLPVVPTAHRLKLVVPFLIKQEHSFQMNVRSIELPMATQTTRQSEMLITPYVIEMNRTGECKPIDNPTATITAGGINHALLIENKGQSKSKPITDPAGCLTTKPHLGIFTDEKWNSFITSYYSTGISNKHITDEMGSVTTKDRNGLTTYQNPRIEDCYYRMLKPHEIQLAMAFDRDYIVLGSSRDKVKQLGNAVTPPAMEWLVGQVVESLN